MEHPPRPLRRQSEGGSGRGHRKAQTSCSSQRAERKLHPRGSRNYRNIDPEETHQCYNSSLNVLHAMHSQHAGLNNLSPRFRPPPAPPRFLTWGWQRSAGRDPVPNIYNNICLFQDIKDPIGKQWEILKSHMPDDLPIIRGIQGNFHSSHER